MQAYEDALVAAVFTPWAEYLLDRVELVSGERLLDLATGPGTVARLASKRVGVGGYVLAADLSEAMLSIASAKPSVLGGSEIDYRQSPAAPLAAPTGEFDVACCQQGLQFFPDRPAALGELRRVLRSRGRLGLAVWAEINLCPPFAAVRDAIGDTLGSDAAVRYRDGPWGLPAPAMLTELAAGARFGTITVEEVRRPVRFEGGAGQLDHSLAASGLAQEVASLRSDQRAALIQAIENNLAGMIDAEGAVNSYLTSHILLAVAT
jgi:SAM-dependent methyltransferase